MVNPTAEEAPPVPADEEPEDTDLIIEILQQYLRGSTQTSRSC